MKETGALRDRVSLPASPAGTARHPVSDSQATSAGSGLASARTSDELSPAQVDRLLASRPGGLFPPDLEGPVEAGDKYSDIDYTHVIHGHLAGVHRAAARTAQGELEEGDALRAAHGVMWGLAFVALLWIGAVLILFSL